MNTMNNEYKYEKMIFILFYAVGFMLLISYTVDGKEWYNNSWEHMSNTPIQNGYRPYVLTLNISNNTATFQNSTHLNISCTAINCQDVRFTLNNETELPYWREYNSTDQTYGKFYINVTGNGSIQLYFNSSNHTDGQSGNKTFRLFDDFQDKPSNLLVRSAGYPTWQHISGAYDATLGYMKTTTDQSKIYTPVSFSSINQQWEFWLRNPAASGSLFWETSFAHVVNTPNGQGYEFYFDGFYRLLKNQSILTSNVHSTNVDWHYIRITRNESGGFTIYENSTMINQWIDKTMITQQSFGVWQQGAGLEGDIDTIRVYPYIIDSPVWSSWSSINSKPLEQNNIFLSSGCGFDSWINNTNLAPTFLGYSAGTGDREVLKTYWANDSDIELFIFYTTTIVDDSSNISLQINGKENIAISSVADSVYNPRYESMIATIPQGANYSIDIRNYDYYEWREYSRKMNISKCIYPDDNQTLIEIIVKNTFYWIVLIIGIIYYFSKRG